VHVLKLTNKLTRFITMIRVEPCISNLYFFIFNSFVVSVTFFTAFITRADLGLARRACPPRLPFEKKKRTGKNKRGEKDVLIWSLCVD